VRRDVCGYLPEFGRSDFGCDTVAPQGRPNSGNPLLRILCELECQGWPAARHFLGDQLAQLCRPRALIEQAVAHEFNQLSVRLDRFSVSPDCLAATLGGAMATRRRSPPAITGDDG